MEPTRANQLDDDDDDDDDDDETIATSITIQDNGREGERKRKLRNCVRA